MDADRWDIVDDTEPRDADAAPPTEDAVALDTRRIERIATLHRAGAQSRKWAAVVVLFCGIGAMDLAVEAVRRVSAGDRRAAIALCFTSVALVAMGAVKFRAARLARASARSLTAEELPPPDFGPLGDGSRRWRDCEHIR